MMTIVTNGPRLASVYCGSPPVIFGIRELSSDTDSANRILIEQAMTIEMINVTPEMPYWPTAVKSVSSFALSVLYFSEQIVMIG